MDRRTDEATFSDITLSSPVERSDNRVQRAGYASSAAMKGKQMIDYLQQMSASQAQYQRQMLGLIPIGAAVGGMSNALAPAQPVNSDNSEKLLLLLEDFE